jgi:hypothetical protein
LKEEVSLREVGDPVGYSEDLGFDRKGTSCLDIVAYKYKARYLFRRIALSCATPSQQKSCAWWYMLAILVIWEV